MKKLNRSHIQYLISYINEVYESYITGEMDDYKFKKEEHLVNVIMSLRTDLIKILEREDDKNENK